MVSTYLFATKFDLEILRRLLCDSTAKVQLIDLTVFVPHWCFVVHHEFASQWSRLSDGWRSIRFDFSTFQLIKREI